MDREVSDTDGGFGEAVAEGEEYLDEEEEVMRRVTMRGLTFVRSRGDGLLELLEGRALGFKLVLLTSLELLLLTPEGGDVEDVGGFVFGVVDFGFGIKEGRNGEGWVDTGGFRVVVRVVSLIFCEESGVEDLEEVVGLEDRGVKFGEGVTRAEVFFPSVGDAVVDLLPTAGAGFSRLSQVSLGLDLGGGILCFTLTFELPALLLMVFVCEDVEDCEDRMFFGIGGGGLVGGGNAVFALLVVRGCVDVIAEEGLNGRGFLTFIGDCVLIPAVGVAILAIGRVSLIFVAELRGFFFFGSSGEGEATFPIELDLEERVGFRTAEIVAI